MPVSEDARILVDARHRDDAAVYRLTDDRAIVATADFFTPIVDDAATWGRIAAANALSDVYAMGGRPLFALNLVGWPREGLPFELLGEVLAGAAEVAARARCPVLGGHSIDDAEPKFGMAVIGEVHPDHLLVNAGARAGELLVLTKPIGTGILTTALKRERLTEAELGEAVRSMTTLNDTAGEAAVACGARCATDVTGFGLLGHLSEIAEASGLSAEVWADQVPLLARARELAAEGVVPGGTRRNLDALGAVAWDADVDATSRLLLADAQTSGGLLIAVAEPRHAELVSRLEGAGALAAATVGVLREGDAGLIRVHRTRTE